MNFLQQKCRFGFYTQGKALSQFFHQQKILRAAQDIHSSPSDFVGVSLQVRKQPRNLLRFI